PEGPVRLALPPGEIGPGHDQPQPELEPARPSGGQHRGQQRQPALAAELRDEAERGVAPGGGGLLPGGGQPGGVGPAQQQGGGDGAQLLVVLQQPSQLPAGGGGGEAPAVERPEAAGGGRQPVRRKLPQRLAGGVQQGTEQAVGQRRPLPPEQSLVLRPRTLV